MCCSFGLYPYHCCNIFSAALSFPAKFHCLSYLLWGGLICAIQLCSHLLMTFLLLFELPPHVPLPTLPVIWSCIWFVAFSFLANQWTKSIHRYLLGSSSARASISFAFFSIPCWVRNFPNSLSAPALSEKNKPLDLAIAVNFYCIASCQVYLTARERARGHSLVLTKPFPGN